MQKPANLKRLTTAQLWAAFRACMASTAEGLKRLAVLWCELKDRGEDMSGYHNSFTSYLPAVAAGKLTPEALILFNPVPALIDAVQKLIPEEQAKLVQKASRVPVRQQDGTTRDMRPIDLSVAQVRQVFGDGVIRTPAQQKRYMPAPRQAPVTQDAMLFAALGLTATQKAELQAEAARDKVSCSAVIVNLLIENGVIRGAVRVSEHKRVPSRRTEAHATA